MCLRSLYGLAFAVRIGLQLQQVALTVNAAPRKSRRQDATGFRNVQLSVVSCKPLLGGYSGGPRSKFAADLVRHEKAGNIVGIRNHHAVDFVALYGSPLGMRFGSFQVAIEIGRFE